MTFRERVKRVFHRSPSGGVDNGKPKIEYYRRHEVPPSKFRGPFDKEHQKRLAAWSFDRALVDRPRSFDLALSPCATYGHPSPSDSEGSPDIAPDDDGVEINLGMSTPAVPGVAQVTSRRYPRCVEPALTPPLP